jgi:RNA polymerase sigma-70 factor (ECF subfamily)
MLALEQRNDRVSEAFERLYHEYYDKIYVYIMRRINHTHDAEDLTADVFLKAFANPYDPNIAKFSTYIYTIAGNALKNYYRANAKQRELCCGELDAELSDETDVLGGLITREEYATLQASLTGLPDRQYAVLYRRYYLDESFREIGAAMGVSESNARQIHFQAIKKLQKA